MLELIELIARIIILIVRGLSAIDATIKVAEESGVSFGTLWANLPVWYK